MLHTLTVVAIANICYEIFAIANICYQLFVVGNYETKPSFLPKLEKALL